MPEPLWVPSDAAIASSAMTAFTCYVEDTHQLEFANYQDLHAWSVSEPARFWRTLWDYLQLKCSRHSDTTVVNLHDFPGARWFPGMRMNFAENLLGAPREKTALISVLENGDRRSLSYAELHRQVACVAQQLQHLGIDSEQRVAAWLPNTTEAVVTMLAASSAGAIFSSCSPDFGEHGALERFSQIEPRVLVAATGYYYAGKIIDIREKVRNVAAQVASVKQIVWVDTLNCQPGLQSAEVFWSDWLDMPTPELTFRQLPFNHPLYILFSSGTTGKPKCIVHSQGGTLLQHVKEHRLHVDLTADDTLFFFTTCGWMMWNWTISALATGSTIVLYDGSPMYPSPTRLFDLADDEKITVFGISAKFLSMTQKAGVQPRLTHDLAGLRTLLSTGSPLTEAGFNYVYTDIKADCHLASMSGGTDIVSCFMLGNPNLPVYSGQLQCAGLGMAVEIWDDQGHELKQGKGELVCTQAFPSCPLGFWNDTDQSRFMQAYFDVFPGVWVHGDYASMTPEHGYIIYGRSDATLNPGGVRIGTAEIYSLLERLPEISDALCVGQPWEDDTRVVLFVVLAEGHDMSDKLSDQIKSYIRQHASPRHVPAIILDVTDVPRTLSGKIAEIAVSQTLAGEPVGNVSALANPDVLREFRDRPELGS
ncbi:MAG: acetoacetate--CoA ligase [bacterium]